MEADTEDQHMDLLRVGCMGSTPGLVCAKSEGKREPAVYEELRVQLVE